MAITPALALPSAVGFAAPWLLAALIIVPLGALLYARRERRARGREAFAAPGVLPSALPSRPGWRRHAPPALYALALAALVLALARPQATIAVPVERATIMLTTDHSGSMAATDVAPTRLQAARDAGDRLLDGVPDQLRVGLVAFDHRAGLRQAPTTDRAAVREALEALEPSGSTATGDGLALALRAARPAGAKATPAAIVLLSDGKSVRGRDPIAVAEEARAAGIPVHTVALGTDEGTIEVRTPDGGTRSEPVPPDRATLERIAEITGGRAFSADDTEELTAVYERLGSQVATRAEEREVTVGAAAGGLLLLVAAAGASLRWFGRLL